MYVCINLCFWIFIIIVPSDTSQKKLSVWNMNIQTEVIIVLNAVKDHHKI